MAARVIDGRDGARRVRERVADGCAAFEARHGRKPGLVGIQVGDDPASEIYQRNKAQQAEEVGMTVERIKLPVGTTQAEMDALLDRLDAATVDLHRRQLSHLGESGLASLIRLLEQARQSHPTTETP